MTLSEYIKELKNLEKQGFGDCKLVSRSDDEGNSYQYCEPYLDVLWVGKQEKYYIEDYYWDDDFDEADSEDYVKTVVIN